MNLKRSVGLSSVIALLVLGAVFWLNRPRQPILPQPVRSAKAPPVVSPVPIAPPVAPSQQPPLRKDGTLANPTERMLAKATTLASKENPPDAKGKVTRTRLVKADFKYPLLRAVETLDNFGRGTLQTVAVADHIMVKTQEGITEQQVRMAADRLGGRMRRKMYSTGMYLIGFNHPDLDTLPTALNRAREMTQVFRSVDADYVVHALATPNDPDFFRLWGMNNIGQDYGAGSGTVDADIDAAEAWNSGTGSTNIVVGVIDTGVNYEHPDLAENIFHNPLEIPDNGMDDDGNGFVDDVMGWDFAYDDNDPMDGHSHGSHCSGTIGGVGNNGIGVAGVNWHVRILPLKFLTDGGSGAISDAVDALRYATRAVKGVRLTSNSWGGGGFTQALEDAIGEAALSNQLFVAAAGNDGRDTDVEPNYPSCYTNNNVISVAATDANDAKASFSNWGLTTVDLGAPGVGIYSCVLEDRYDYYNGTSMATPHVAGAAALLWSRNFTAPYSHIKSNLFAGANPISSLAGMCVTGSRLNVHNSVLMMSLGIVGSEPNSEEVLSSPPSTFVVHFTDALNTNSVQASDLKVNGVPANGVAITDASTLTYTFISSPVSNQGPQIMSLAEDVLARLSDSKSNTAWQSTFYYDLVPLQVTAQTPVCGSVVGAAEMTNIVFSFNEPIDTNSVMASTLVLNQGVVTGFRILDSQNVEFVLSNITVEGTLKEGIGYGRMRDAYGNPCLAYIGSNIVDYIILPFTAKLYPREVLGASIYETKFSAIMGFTNDTDTFIVMPDPGQSFSVAVSPTNSLQPVLEIRDPSNVLLASATASGPGLPAILASVPITTPGGYSVTVSSVGGTTGKYTIHLLLNATYEVEDWGGASNDTRATAQSLDGGWGTLTDSVQRAGVRGSGSNDYYSLTLSTNDILNVGVLASSNGMAELELYDSSGALLDASVPIASNLDGIISDFKVPGTGLYYLRVAGAATNGYTMVLTRNGSFDTEWNNDLATAQDITASGAAIGHIVRNVTAFTSETEPNDDGISKFSPNDLNWAEDIGKGWVFKGLNPEGGTNTYLRSVLGVISADRDRDWDFYRFRAKPGELMYGYMYSLDGQSDTYVRMYDRCGNLLYEWDNDWWFPDAFMYYRWFPYDGEYYLAADTKVGHGPYQLDIYQNFTGPVPPPFDSDYYRVQANAGDTLTLFTGTPGGGDAEPYNALDPAVELFSPSGTLVASNYDGAADGKNAALSFPVTTSGAHTIRVMTTNRPSGEYFLRVTGYTGSLPSFHVTSTVSPDGGYTNAVPATMVVNFSHHVLLTSVQGSDLKIDGMDCTGFTVTDGNSIRFHLPAIGHGTHTVTMNAGAVTSTLGVPVAAYSGVLHVDLIPPRVISSVPAQGANVPSGSVTNTIVFSEPMLTNNITAADVYLWGTRSGQRTASYFAYNPTTLTLTLVFDGLTDDAYTLSLFSGLDRFEDYAHNGLDGNGDGVGGDSWRLNFLADSLTSTPITGVSPDRATESAVYRASVGAYMGAGDSDSFTISLDTNQTLTVVMDPSATLRPSVQVTGPSGSLGSATAPAAGKDAVVQTIAINTPGLHTITVTGHGGTVGDYTVETLINAAVEMESHDGGTNHTLASAQNVDASFLTLAGTSARGAVVGRGDGVPGEKIGPDGFGYCAVPTGMAFEDIRATGHLVPIVIHGAFRFEGFPGYGKIDPLDLDGFTFPFYGVNQSNIYVNINGYITFESGWQVDYNYYFNLTNQPPYATIAPMMNYLRWKNYYDDANIYYELRGSGNQRRLVIQWDSVHFWADDNPITFQVILNEADGSMQFNYPDLLSNGKGSNGGTSIVGIKDNGIQGANRLMVSASGGPSEFISTGKATKIGVGLGSDPHPDYYAFTLSASNRVSLAFTTDSSTNGSLQLVSSAGAVLASGAKGGTNVTLSIANYLVPSNGTYYARVEASPGVEYTLVVGRDTALDVEPNDSIATARTIFPGAVLGAVSGTNTDFYSFLLAPGDPVTLETRTPGDGPYEIVNTLDPSLELYGPNGGLITSNLNGAADGRNARIVHTATNLGVHRVRVLATSGSGPYVVQATYATSPMPYVSVTATDPSASETGPDVGVFTVSRTGPTASPLAVEFAMSGSAGNGTDYNWVSSPVIIPVGASSIPVVITPINDYANDDNEKVKITLLPSETYFLAETNITAQITITDNDNDLVWTGATDTNWNLTAANWTGDSTVYHEGASVLFKNQGVTLYQTNVVIQPSGVFPNSVIISNTTSSKTFTFSGGDIGGNASIVKHGIWSANTKAVFKDYTGSLSFTGGTTNRGGTISFLAGTNGISSMTRTQWFGRAPIVMNNEDYPDTIFEFGGGVLVNGQTNVFGNDLVLPYNNSCILKYGRAVAGYPSPKIVFAGNILLEDSGIVFLDGECPGGKLTGLDPNGHEITGDIILNGDAAIRRINDPKGVAFSISGNIRDGGVPGSISFANECDKEYPNATLKIRGTNNTYSGGTGIGFKGFYTNNFSTFFGSVDVESNSCLGSGDVYVGDGGLLRLFGPENIAPTATLTVEYSGWTYEHGVLYVVSGVTNTVSKLVIATNEYTSGIYSAATHPDYLPGPGAIRVEPYVTPTVSISATDPIAAEFGVNPGQFTVTRTGSTARKLSVVIAVSGSAVNGTDYTPTIGHAILIPAGNSSATVTISPVNDGIPEGTETVTLTIQTNVTYNIGAQTNATVTILDAPYDQWRFDKFGASALSPWLAADTADPDNDSVNNLLEYAFGMEPMVSGTDGLPESGRDGDHLTLTYVRRKAPVDITYTPEVSGSVTGAWSNSGVSQELKADDGLFQVIEATDPATISGNPGRFIRVKVSRP